MSTEKNSNVTAAGPASEKNKYRTGGSFGAACVIPGAGYINGVDILADGGQNAGIFVPQI